ncbi:YggT family protein [Candidatus Parcubacteria bacterium]|nr:YggT family protein [Candidatus Parcubacteria bacterium]
MARVVEDNDTRAADGGTTVVNTGGTAQPVAVDRASQIVWLIVGVIETLLALRLILRLLGASTASAFVQFIYALSRPLVSPFFGIFNLQIENELPGLEVATLFAMLVYALAGYLIVAAIKAVRGRA